MRLVSVSSAPSLAPEEQLLCGAVIGELDVFLSRLCVALNKKGTRRKTCFPKEEMVLLLPSFAAPNRFHEVSSVLHKSLRALWA